MASTTPTPDAPDWVRRWPDVYSIVTGYIPEKKPEGGKPKCRPLLVTQVLRKKGDGRIYLRVAYGTSKIKLLERAGSDLIVQNIDDLDACGLMTPTRFVINPADQFIRPWDADHFAPWGGSGTPRRGKLTDEMQREYAWLMSQYLTG